MNAYKSIGERADSMLGRHFYQSGIGFGRVIRVELVWANVAHLTIQLRNGALISPLRATTI